MSTYFIKHIYSTHNCCKYNISGRPSKLPRSFLVSKNHTLFLLLFLKMSLPFIRIYHSLSKMKLHLLEIIMAVLHNISLLVLNMCYKWIYNVYILCSTSCTKFNCPSYGSVYHNSSTSVHIL